MTVPPAGAGPHEPWRVDPVDEEVVSKVVIGSDPFPPIVAAGVVAADDDQRAPGSFEMQGVGRGMVWRRDRLWIATDGRRHGRGPGTGDVERAVELVAPSDDEVPIRSPVRSLVWVTIEVA